MLSAHTNKRFIISVTLIFLFFCNLSPSIAQICGLRINTLLEGIDQTKPVHKLPVFLVA